MAILVLSEQTQAGLSNYIGIENVLYKTPFKLYVPIKRPCTAKFPKYYPCFLNRVSRINGAHTLLTTTLTLLPTRFGLSPLVALMAASLCLLSVMK